MLADYWQTVLARRDPGGAEVVKIDGSYSNDLYAARLVEAQHWANTTYLPEKYAELSTAEEYAAWAVFMHIIQHEPSMNFAPNLKRAAVVRRSYELHARWDMQQYTRYSRIRMGGAGLFDYLTFYPLRLFGVKPLGIMEAERLLSELDN
jgi:hypothetical protein